MQGEKIFAPTVVFKHFFKPVSNHTTFEFMKRKRAFGLWLIFLIVLLVLIAIGRDSILQWAVKREQAHLKTNYHLNLSIGSVKFIRWNRVQLHGVAVQPGGADTLAVIQNLEIRPALISLLTGKLNFNELKIDSAVITVFNSNDRNNLLFLKSRQATGEISRSAKHNFYERAEDLKNNLFRLLNTAVEISELRLSYRDTTFVEQVYVPQLVFDRHDCTGVIINEQLSDTLDLSAEVREKNVNYEVTLKHRGNMLTYLPFLDAEHGFKCRFQSVTAEVKLEEAGGTLQVSPTISVENFHVQHWRLAKEDVVLPSAQFRGLIKIKEDGFELDSSSTGTLNHASFKLFTSYQTMPDTVFALGLHMPETVSDTFFDALPGGMFNTLKGIKCSGTLAYDLQFLMNTRQPDSLIFESQLRRKNFHIIQSGAEDYARINEPFVYDAFSGEQFVRHIVVGPENPEFTPLNHISPNLPVAIMQSEDPSFMVHRGFVPESFRESIAQNYKQHRFARGGSTISMQLVKNVFLTRNKTISRKAEEALIVYLIENLGLMPKERMMEVYLNVIEWGPNVYGVTEAARFYFNKRPIELTLQECIFLAAIIPNPKYFKYQFDKSGELKGYMGDFFKIIANRMVMRGYLSERDTFNFVPHVKLSGPALQMVMPMDSVLPGGEDNLPVIDNE